MYQLIPIILLLYITLSMYSYVSILPFLATTFETTDFVMQFTVVSFMFSYGFFNSFWLFLSSIISDKVILISSMLLALLGIAITILSNHIGYFFTGRICEAIGTCGTLVIIRAYMHKRYGPKNYFRYIKNVFIYVFFVCCIGPMLGFLTFQLFGWRYVFGFLLIINLLVNIYVSLVYIGSKTEYILKSSLKTSAKNFISLFSNKQAMGFLLPSTLTLSGCYSYFVIALNIFMMILSYKIGNFFILNIPIVLSFTLGVVIGNFLIDKWSYYRICSFSFVFLFFSVIFFLFFYRLNSFSAISIVLPLSFFFLATGILGPIGFLKAKIANAIFQIETAVIFPFMIFIFAAILSFIISLLNLYSTIGLNTLYIVLILISALSFFFLAKPDNQNLIKDNETNQK